MSDEVVVRSSQPVRVVQPADSVGTSDNVTVTVQGESTVTARSGDSVRVVEGAGVAPSAPSDGTAIVRWGPNFGTPGGDSLPQRAAMDIQSVELIGDLPVTYALKATDLQIVGYDIRQAQKVEALIHHDAGNLTQFHSLDLGHVGLIGDVRQSHKLDVADLRVAGGVQQVQNIDIFEASLVGDIVQAQRVEGGADFAVPGLSQVQEMDIYAVDLDGNVEQRQAVGAKVLGAPFWTSVATSTDTGGVGGTNQFVVNMPSNVAEGDLLLAFVTSDASGLTIAPPAGWALVRNAVVGTLKTGLWYKIAGPNEPASYTFTSNVNGQRWTGEIHRIRGVDPVNPINTHNGGAASVADPVVPAVITTVPSCLVMAFCCHVHTAVASHTPPASNVERTEFEVVNVSIHNSSSYTRIFPSAGNTGTATINCSALLASNAAYIRVAIAPGEFALT